MSLLTRDIACRELVELVTEYLEGALPRRARRRFERHIRGCEHCSAYLEQIRETIERAGRLGVEDLDPAARNALLEAFRGWRLEGAN